MGDQMQAFLVDDHPLCISAERLAFVILLIGAIVFTHLYYTCDTYRLS